MGKDQRWFAMRKPVYLETFKQRRQSGTTFATIHFRFCGTSARKLRPPSVGVSCPQQASRGVERNKSMAANTYSQGAQVEHQKFGLGTVMSSSEERIVIKFDDHGEKKFVTTMVMGSLKKSDRQPPAEKKGSRRKKAAPATA